MLLQDQYHITEALLLVFGGSTSFLDMHMLSTLIRIYVFTSYLVYPFPVAFFWLNINFIFQVVQCTSVSTEKLIFIL